MQVGAGADGEVADVAAPQGEGPAAGGGADRLVQGQAHLQHSGRDAEAHGAGVAGAGIAVARDRDRGARVEQVPGGGQRGTGGEVAGGQHGRDRRPHFDREPARRLPRGGGPGGGRGERLDVGGVEVVHVVHARGAQLGGERHPAGAAQLVAVHAQAQARVGAGAQHPLRLLGVESALLAEDVDPAHVRGDRGEHLAGDQVDVVLGAAGELAGHQVGAEEGALVQLTFLDQRGDQPRGLELVLGREAVAGLGLEGGGAAGDRLGDPGAHQLAQALGGGGTGGLGGHADAAGRVGAAGHAGLELRGTVPVEDQVGVGIHPAGQHGPAAEVLGRIGRGGLRGGPGPGDRALLDDQGRIAQDLLLADPARAGGVVERGVEGPQLGDAGDQGARHGPRLRAGTGRAQSPPPPAVRGAGHRSRLRTSRSRRRSRCARTRPAPRCGPPWCGRRSPGTPRRSSSRSSGRPGCPGPTGW